MCRSGKASTETDPRLLTCGDAGEVLLYSPNSIPGAPPLQRLRGHHAGAYCSTWLSAKSCATGGFDRRAFLWDLRQQKPRAAMQTRQHVYSMAAVENDLFVGLGEGCIAQWDLRFGPPVRELRGHGAAVEALAVVPGALASAGSDGVLRLWSRQGEPTWHFSTRGALTCMSTVAEDSLLVGGHGLPPTALSLDYDKAIMHVPKALKQMNLPSMRMDLDGWDMVDILICGGVAGQRWPRPPSPVRMASTQRREVLLTGVRSRRPYHWEPPVHHTVPSCGLPMCPR
ncbi:unnamed protein product [Durusdinium trenchii]|uniref:Uncharacterized protein n=1 Tax=Durusdinium trenchii TaxID=1381693 RepID=A0ABP0PHE5_9DINO